MGFKEAGLRGSLRNVSVGASVIPDSAIHRWTFSEGGGTTAADSIGTTDIQINGASWVSNTWQDGFALDFDGSDDDAFAPYDSDFDTKVFTITATVEPDTIEDGDRIIDFFSNSNYGYLLDFTATGNLEFATAESGQSFSGFVGNTAIQTGTKTRVGVTYDNGAVELFINASSDGSGAVNVFTDVNGNLDFYLGSNQGGSSFVDSRLDDVIFYNSVLTASELQQDYDNQPWS